MPQILRRGGRKVAGVYFVRLRIRDKTLPAVEVIDATTRSVGELQSGCQTDGTRVKWAPRAPVAHEPE